MPPLYPTINLVQTVKVQVSSPDIVVVGEKTGSGGLFVMGFPLLPAGFQMLLSVGRSYDPRTGKTWEVEGVTPDVEVNPEQALQAAVGHFRGLTAIR